MKVKEIRELTTEQIEAKITEVKDEIFNLRMQQATGNLEKPSRIHELRKDVARMKTILAERKEAQGGLLMEKKKHEVLGKVVSAKNDKTITILVETYKKDPKYGKRVKYSKKYTAHDENNQAKVGDVVRVVETKPLSKTKRFSLVEIVEEAVILQALYN